MKERNPKIKFENCRLMYRNFQGKQTQYNAEGMRSFCVIIDDLNFAEQLKKDGWNVKFRDGREDTDAPTAYMQIKVSYKNIPPTVHLISGDSNILLDEESVGSLDWAEIENVDMVVSGSWYDINGRSGYSAYLRSMYVTISEDPFAKKYSYLEPAKSPDEEVPF